MNWVGIVISLFGMVYLLYSVVNRKKVTIYNRSVEVINGKEADFLSLQLLFSILNSIVLILSGFILIRFEISTLVIVVVPLIFHIVNLFLKIISRQKGYIR